MSTSPAKGRRRESAADGGDIAIDDALLARAAYPAPSATFPDWTRERKSFWAWSPSRSLLASLRAHERASRSRGLVATLQRKLAVLRHRFWSIVTGADVPLGCRIAGGLQMPHPNGIVIHPEARIGPNCILFQQVTLGTAGVDGKVPTLGGHVDIGAGAKVLGGIVLGDHCHVGANAVVLADIPPGKLAIGVPARVVD